MPVLLPRCRGPTDPLLSGLVVNSSPQLFPSRPLSTRCPFNLVLYDFILNYVCGGVHMWVQVPEARRGCQIP